MIEHATIGSRCVIDNGAIIGCLGFGFEREGDVVWPFPQIGKVVIGNSVQIGPGTMVCRGALTDTVIADMVKLDGNVWIAHGVRLGKATMLAAHAQTSGSVEIGERTWMAPNCSVRQKLRIGSDAFVGIGTVVVKDVPDGTVVYGNPAKEKK